MFPKRLRIIAIFEDENDNAVATVTSSNDIPTYDQRDTVAQWDC
jgi:hypothetical protein